MIYGIGNGDYFALDARAAEESPVLYWAHDRGVAEEYAPTFEAWLKKLPEWLNPPGGEKRRDG
ncbi:MAG: SMI1/KNR4 family protein [Anaeromyxobacteraceae bacterium]